MAFEAVGLGAPGWGCRPPRSSGIWRAAVFFAASAIAERQVDLWALLPNNPMLVLLLGERSRKEAP
jgi:hypothetical protein